MDNDDNTQHSCTNTMLSIISSFPFFFSKVCKVRTEKHITETLPSYLFSPRSCFTKDKTPSHLNPPISNWVTGNTLFFVLCETSVKQVRPTRGFSVKYIMTKRLTTEPTPSQFLVTGALGGQRYVPVWTDRLGSPATPTAWLMCFWAQIQCPAVNLIIFSLAIEIPSEKVSVITLVTPLCVAESVAPWACRCRGGGAGGGLVIIPPARLHHLCLQPMGRAGLVMSSPCPTAIHSDERSAPFVPCY